MSSPKIFPIDDSKNKCAGIEQVEIVRDSKLEIIPSIVTTIDGLDTCLIWQFG